MGDPAGIGPEVVLKAVMDPRVQRVCRPLIIGDLGVLKRAATRAYKWRTWERTAPPAGFADGLWVCPVTRLSEGQSRPGHPAKGCGEASYRYIIHAVELLQSGFIACMATAPISKKMLHAAGHRYPGHTELLAELTHTRECRMMLFGRRLKVVLATVHVPLMRVARELTQQKITATLRITTRALREWFGLQQPRLAVAGLNPHAGEDGLLGAEERRLIAPAIEAARKEGIDATGPEPADSLFFRAHRGEFDAVVCMYHDQGLGPFKLLHFTDGVNLTLGLPIIRTSVDHGTAYELAGRNVADSTSMKEAILLAARLSRRDRAASATRAVSSRRG